MNRQELIAMMKDKMKSLLKFADTSNVFVTKDGQKIASSAPELSIDSEVFLLDGDGNQTPLEDGDYEMEDGTTITVTNGVVSAISTVENNQDNGDEVTTAMEDLPVETPPQDAPVDKELIKRIDALEKLMDDILPMVQKIMDSNVKMSNQIMEFAKQPESEP